MTNPTSPGRVVILNDTSLRQHHGCARVMRVLREGLANVGLEVIATSPARHDWAADMMFKAAMAAADLIVINGEGTLHHGRPAGEALVRVVDDLTATGRPVALVNALYQDNPVRWGRHLRQMALLVGRDQRSAEALADIAPDVPVRVMPDLSLCEGAVAVRGVRDQVIFGDSVKLTQRRALLRAAAVCKADMVLPMKTRSGLLWRFGPTRSMLYRGYCAEFGAAARKTVLAKNEAHYLDLIARARLHVTGRFHSVCLSLVTGTPFLALGSNSWKIEALLAEAGVDPDRLVTPAALAALGPADMERPFTLAETTNIAAFLTKAQSDGERLFRDLALLARGRTN